MNNNHNHNHDGGNDDSHKAPAVNSTVPKKRKRIVTLPRDVVAYYNKRRVRERSGSCDASQQEIFRTETERQQALMSLKNSRTGLQVHVVENNDDQPVHQVGHADASRSPDQRVAEKEKKVQSVLTDISAHGTDVTRHVLQKTVKIRTEALHKMERNTSMRKFVHPPK